MPIYEALAYIKTVIVYINVPYDSLIITVLKMKSALLNSNQFIIKSSFHTYIKNKIADFSHYLN